MKAIEDESGAYDFYLGYPFIQGTMADGTFFQAPLFLHPIRLEKENVNQQRWVLKEVEDEPQINRTLFLAFKKVNGLSFSDDWLDEVNELPLKHDIQQWVTSLQKVFPTLSFQSTGIKRLKEYKKDDIPDVVPFTLFQHAIIGNFPQGGSALVKDYDQLIQLSEDEHLALAEELINPQDNANDLSAFRIDRWRIKANSSCI